MPARSPVVQNEAGAGVGAEPVWSPPPESIVVTIANGQTTSGPAEVQGKLVGLLMPASWTAADLTIEASIDGGAFYGVYDSGTPRTIPSAEAQAGRLIALQLGDWLLANWVHVKSSVAQAAARDITLIIAR